MTANVAKSNPLQKINEDNKLRPFMSSLFDAESYIKNVIKEGRSEECFADVVSGIEDINVKIKEYISLHKDNLMSGMQDVAALAERYSNLSASSQKLRDSISRMKKEAMESHALVSTRTHELERIHETSIILHQLKQFASAKTQLDAYLAEHSDKDVRNLSSAAKTLSELERLLLNPKLLEIKFVSDYVGNVKMVGKNIRMLAQERLLSAIVDKNQAAIASSLQVFYNLDSLPEIVLLVVDQTVKSTVEASRDALDFDLLGGVHGDLLSGGAATAGLPNSASKRPLNPASGALGTTGAGGSTSSQLSLPQMRIAIRELAHHWSAAVHDKATQIHVFQRVVAKKEDPSSHEKFSDVLRKVGSTNGRHMMSSSNNVSQQYLVNGQLLELYWFRLSVALNDIAADKLRTHSLAACRAYPYLRSAAVEVVANLQQWTEKDSQRDQGSGGGIGLHVTAFASDLLSASSRETRGQFGSLQWSQDDLLGCSSSRFGSSNRRNNDRNSSYARGDSDRSTKRHVISADIASGTDGDCHLVTGFKPIRDRYLAAALKRMTVPIEQMFPDVDGYSAAVPSKRDMQALIKAVQAEFVTAVVEGDVGLLFVVCKEFQKAVQLMLTKVEGMVSNSVETRKISSQNGFARTSHQEHNGQLLALLIQLKEALDKIPSTVMRQLAQETDTGGLSALGAQQRGAQEEAMDAEITRAVGAASSLIEDLASRQILDSVVALLSGYSKSLLMGMHKEGVVNVSGSKSQSPVSGADDDHTLECSAAIQTLVKQMPVMIKAHILTLTRCAVVDRAVEEICLRTMHSYITIAAVVRPVNELTRLRTAKDMTALEMLLSGICTVQNQDQCPVVQEFRSFRRLLFQEEDKTKLKSNVPGNSPPNREFIFQQDYVMHIRPSTLLGYYVSCGPTQLLSPYDVTPGFGLQTYVEELTTTPDSVDGQSAVRLLYAVNGDRSDWRRIDNEKRSWEIVQQCLDSFFQRITVAEGAQKISMRAWYEAILDLGSHYYGNN